MRMNSCSNYIQKVGEIDNINSETVLLGVTLIQVRPVVFREKRIVFLMLSHVLSNYWGWVVDV